MASCDLQGHHSRVSVHHFRYPPEEKYGREVRVIAVDFMDGQEVYPRIAEELADLDIGVLGKGGSAV